jgi:glycosyltransferase involved in cell wall biosynthesis
LAGPLEIVGDTNRALLVESENPAALAAGLERIISDPRLAHSLAENAFKRVQAYSYQAVGPQLVEVLEKVAGKGAPHLHESSRRCSAPL